MPQDVEEQELDDQPHDPDTRSQPWSPLWGSGVGFKQRHQSSGFLTSNALIRVDMTTVTYRLKGVRVMVITEPNYNTNLTITCKNNIVNLHPITVVLFVTLGINLLI